MIFRRKKAQKAQRGRAATNEIEQEQTEKTEGEKLCRECRVFVDSTAKSLPRITRIARMGKIRRNLESGNYLSMKSVKSVAKSSRNGAASTPDTSARRPDHTVRHCGALTIIEMLVSTTLLTFMVIGLTAMFMETQKAFKAGVKQSTTSDAGHTIIDIIGTDLSQMSDAQTPGITNLFWSGFTNDDTFQYQDASTHPYRTNQLQEIFALVHTNTQWLGIGYAVSNASPGVGTLYRYLVTTNAPLLDNSLFTPFLSNAVFATNFGLHFDRVADGVIHLRIHVFDQYGNEYEQGQEYASNNSFYRFSYPAPGYTNVLPGGITNIVPQAGLPNSIQLEVGVLEPEVFEQLRALPTTAQPAFLRRLGGNIQIFRQNIPISAATR
jgi:hypothetical protein